jgi:hypothetical protein
MSKLSRLAGKTKTITLEGVELVLTPLTVKDMDLFVKLEDKNQMGESMREIVFRTLKGADAEITQEEVDDISFENLQTLMDEIMNLNGLKDVDDKKQALINKMKNARS